MPYNITKEPTKQTTNLLLNPVYRYIYKYIVILRQTVSLYHNSSVWQDTLDSRSCTLNYSRGIEDVEDLHEVCPKGAQRRSERKTLSWQRGDDLADQFRSRSSWCSGDLRWKLDLLLWPRDQETKFPVEAYWLSQIQEG